LEGIILRSINVDRLLQGLHERLLKGLLGSGLLAGIGAQAEGLAHLIGGSSLLELIDDGFSVGVHEGVAQSVVGRGEP
jgi:hypothetical protein